MKKQFFALVLAVLLVMLTACGSITDSEDSTSQTSTAAPEKLPEGLTPEGLLQDIEKDCAATLTLLTGELAAIHTAIGGTYDGYSQHHAQLDLWYALVEEETNALLDRVEAQSHLYYKLVAQSADHMDAEALDDAMADFYDRTLDDALEGFYEEIYDEQYDSIYEIYYEGVLEGAYNHGAIDFDQYEQESDELYQNWHTASLGFSDLIMEHYDTFEQEWRRVNGAFMEGNFDVNAILNL